jgi:murein DD-endopeptidase MepM/ murein hydrolase activator NlpD
VVRALVLLSICIGAVGCAHGQERYYVMQRGDTLYSASRELGVPVQQLMTVNGIDDARNVAVGTRLKLPGVEGGLRPLVAGTQAVSRTSQPLVGPSGSRSTLSSTPRPAQPAAGPSMPVTYAMAKGDTLYSIAARFGLDVADLIRINDIDDPHDLATGTVLTLEGAGGRTADLDGPVLWPTDGERQTLTGKLGGVAIRGAPGQPVRSVSSGTVTWSGQRRGYGYVVLVRNDRYVYAYLNNEQVLVQVGDRVQVGSEIGKLGVTADDNTAQLYFVVTKDGRFVDPRSAPRA